MELLMMVMVAVVLLGLFTTAPTRGYLERLAKFYVNKRYGLTPFVFNFRYAVNVDRHGNVVNYRETKERIKRSLNILKLSFIFIGILVVHGVFTITRAFS